MLKMVGKTLTLNVITTMIILKRTKSTDKDFLELTMQLDIDLRNIYGSTQDEFDQYNSIIDVNNVVIAYENNIAVGCGCFKATVDNVIELKRMYVNSAHRGKGVGVAILTELENWAIEIGFNLMVLETGTLQPAAIQLYKKQGYQIIPNYDPYIGNELSVCMKKILTKNT
jgi:GNAT superfamily N-acetyltransferase